MCKYQILIYFEMLLVYLSVKVCLLDIRLFIYLYSIAKRFTVKCMDGYYAHIYLHFSYFYVYYFACRIYYHVFYFQLSEKRKNKKRKYN